MSASRSSVGNKLCFSISLGYGLELESCDWCSGLKVEWMEPLSERILFKLQLPR